MSGKTVLITGITGFVATQVALSFLREGWSVKGTVRSESKGKTVAALPCFKDYTDKISFAIVENITDRESVLMALDGVDAVAHVASPFNVSGASWEKDYREPAVAGTRTVMLAAKEYPRIKNVVVTSSHAAIGTFTIDPVDQSSKVYSEADWNPVTEKDCQSLTAETNGGAWYCASKKFAEEEAWKIAKTADYKVSTICPPMIYGPALQDIKDIDHLNTSSAEIYSMMKADGSSKNGSMPPTVFPVFADVRNVADAHYEAVARNLDGRFAICSGNYDNATVIDIIGREFPQLKDRLRVPQSEDRIIDKVYKLSGAKAAKELGIKYIPLETTIKDTVTQLLEVEKK